MTAEVSGDKAIHGLLRRHWPPEGQVCLLLAAFAEPDVARRAWRKWQAENDLALADHADMRLLAAIAPRIREIEPDMPLDPRLEGMRRYIWAVNHVTLGTTLPLLRTMRAAGLRLMLLKGVARLAQDPNLLKERALRDVDVLVHPDDWERAVAVTREAGWQPSLGEERRLTKLASHAVGMSGPNSRAGSEFDLHRFAIRQNQCEGDDLGLWQRAQRAALQGVDLLVPSVTDQAMIALSQATIYNHRPHPALWALDVGAFLRTGAIDWNHLTEETERRRIALFVAAPLLLLRERLDLAIPEQALGRLARPVGQAYQVEFASRAMRYKPANAAEAKAFRIVTAARAMRLARAVPEESRDAKSPSLTWRAARLDPGGRLTVPIPEGMRPLARLRLEVSFRAFHAGQRSRLQVMSDDLALMLIPIGAASRGRGGRRRYRGIVHIPACLLTLRGPGSIQLVADRKLRIRSVVVRFGPADAEPALARIGGTLKSWWCALPPLRRRSAEPASP